MSGKDTDWGGFLGRAGIELDLRGLGGQRGWPLGQQRRFLQICGELNGGFSGDAGEGWLETEAGQNR